MLDKWIPNGWILEVTREEATASHRAQGGYQPSQGYPVTPASCAHTISKRLAGSLTEPVLGQSGGSVSMVTGSHSASRSQHVAVVPKERTLSILASPLVYVISTVVHFKRDIEGKSLSMTKSLEILQF